MTTANRANETWTQFFADDYLRFGPFLRTPELTQQTVDGIQNLLRLTPDCRLLDLCCGMGRISIPLAQAGYNVVGVDGAPVVLESARQKSAELGLQIEFHHQDARDLAFDEEFDALINIGGAFGYCEDPKDDEVMLGAMYRSLKPGGKLLMEMHNRDGYVKTYTPEPFSVPFGPAVMHTKFGFDPVTGRWTYEMNWEEDGRPKSATLVFRLYTATEMVKLLHQAGFREIQVFGEWDGSALDKPHPYMMLLAQK